MKNKFDNEYIDGRIESMLIAKIAHYRLQLRNEFKTRHNQRYPELHYTSIKGSIRNLRVWNKMAKLIDHGFGIPYPVYMAEKLTTI